MFMPLMFAGDLIVEATAASSLLLAARAVWALPAWWRERRDFKLWAQELATEEVR